jgi:glycosyltransferase involved in cell wall biosynthesis
MFCDSAKRQDLPRYFRQVEALDWPPSRLRVYAVEGDSSDDTRAQIDKWLAAHKWAPLLRHDIGHKPRGSVVDVDRMIDGSAVASTAVQAAVADGWADYVLWVESDLIWGPGLLQGLMGRGRALVAAWVLVELYGSGSLDYRWLEATAEHDAAFYDTWAFRTLPDGKGLFDMRCERPRGAFPLWSAGSSLLMPADVAGAVCRSNPRAIVGWCEAAREMGGETWCHPETHVWHPNYSISKRPA